jgi:hypothetical protein
MPDINDPRLWAPPPSSQWHPPSPWVTHQDMATVHSKIGGLEQGQQSIIQTYAHLRGEMLRGFDEMKGILREQSEAQRKPDEPDERGTIKLNAQGVMIIIAASIALGALFGRPILSVLTMGAG